MPLTPEEAMKFFNSLDEEEKAIFVIGAMQKLADTEINLNYQTLKRDSGNAAKKLKINPQKSLSLFMKAASVLLSQMLRDHENEKE